MTEAPPIPPEPPIARPGKPLVRWRWHLLVGMVVMLAIIVAAFLSPWFSRQRPEDARPVVVAIEPGDTLTRAAERLQEAGVISSAGRFTLLAQMLGGGAAIQAGEYEFFADEGWSQHLATLEEGRTVRRAVSVPEGLPSVLVHERLMAAQELTGEVAVPEEGSVLPATYDYRRGESRAAVLARMQQGMAAEVARAWAARSPNAPVSSPREAIILASIVEKETAKPEERRRVAGVYANRLRQNMPLQADPTVIYPVTRGRPLGRRILRSELDDSSNTYNTYARRGLPSGPIANPGRESIAAALDPESHDFLYFVADGSGGHVFARTLEEHEANVARWREIERERGER